MEIIIFLRKTTKISPDYPTLKEWLSKREWMDSSMDDSIKL